MKLIIIAAALAAVWHLTTSCTSMPVATPTIQPPPPAPQYQAAWGPAHPDWTADLVAAIHNYGDALPMPASSSAVAVPVKCDKIQFYTMFFSAIAYYESSFKPDAKYVESFRGMDGNPQVSGGLLQLSVDDGKIYGCDFHKEADLYDVEKNLACGVRICAHWAPKDGVLTEGSGEARSPARGCARYWSTLREGPKHHRAEILAAAWRTCK